MPRFMFAILKLYTCSQTPGVLGILSSNSAIPMTSNSGRTTTPERKLNLSNVKGLLGSTADYEERQIERRLLDAAVQARADVAVKAEAAAAEQKHKEENEAKQKQRKEEVKRLLGGTQEFEERQRRFDAAAFKAAAEQRQREENHERKRKRKDKQACAMIRMPFEFLSRFGAC